MVKVCAESQLDSPLEKCSALIAVDTLVRGGTVPKDVEALDLYEWACRNGQPPVDFSETLGVLRLRWVKANPRSASGPSCLQACLRHWDLMNAQQVLPPRPSTTALGPRSADSLDCCHP